MKNIRYALIGAAVLFTISSTPLAIANTVNINGSSPTTPQPFGVYCSPYSASFVSGNYYIPTEGGSCYYSLPSLGGAYAVLQIYKGTPGNAILIPDDDANTPFSNTILSTSPNVFNGSQGDDFFIAVYGVNSQADLTNTENYLQTGGAAPAGITLNLLPWKWGVAPDTQAPTVAITDPLNGSGFLQNQNVFVVANISDNIGVATTTYTLNGIAVDPAVALPLGTQPLGTATLVVSASDAAGNTGYATSTFTILPPDLTAPGITISSPTAGSTYNDTATVFLTATVTDASAIAATSYTFNGTNIDSSKPLPLLGAPLGPASVSVAATDVYGNASSSTVNFFIKSSDVTPPTIVITNPVAGHTYQSTDTVLASATITDASGVANTSYVLDGITVNPAQPLPLALAGNGPATLVVTATDTFGNSASSSITFNITTPPPPDTQAPVITIVSPFQGKKYARNDTVMIVANITDASPIANVRYYFNGTQVDPSAPLQFSKAPLGTATLKVVATDSFGNVGSSTSTFRILPGSNSCIADITEAFDHKWISNKNVFKDAFEDCAKMNDRGHDRDNARDDDNKKQKDYQSDDRYLKAQKDITDTFNDLDTKINR